MVNESCAFCGVEPASGKTHPWVGVCRKTDLAPDREPVEANQVWAAVPCCQNCHVDPSRRTLQLKAHFFGRDQVRAAVGLAGSSDIGGQA